MNSGRRRGSGSVADGRNSRPAGFEKLFYTEVNWIDATQNNKTANCIGRLCRNNQPIAWTRAYGYSVTGQNEKTDDNQSTTCQ